ncbi:MAG TPA: hypothetical protein VGE77_06505 [Nocardioides sp.]
MPAPRSVCSRSPARARPATGLAGWWVGRVDRDVVRVVSEGPDAARYQHSAGLAPLSSQPLASLTVAPEVAAVLEGGSYAGPLPQTAWRATYESLGVRGVACAGGYDEDARQWILSLSDDTGRDLRPLRLLVSAVAQAALGMARPRRG